MPLPRRPLLTLALGLAVLILSIGAVMAQTVGGAPTGSSAPNFMDGVGGLLNGLSQSLGTSAAGGGTATLSGRIIQLIALMTVLSIAPGLLVVMTSFTRFVIVFSMLRSALGLSQSPPNMVLNAMALFMTFFVMQPVFTDAWQTGLQPLMENRDYRGTGHRQDRRAVQGLHVRQYAAAQTTACFSTSPATRAAPQAPPAAETPMPRTPQEAGWSLLVPSFMISELRRAFTIGFLIYLPFVAIDLIVASVLMSAGMMMLPPVMISLPFKVIFFVLIDGWYMLAGSLMQSYLPYAGGG